MTHAACAPQEAAPPLPRDGLPEGFRIGFDSRLRRLDGGRTLLGGAPTRLLRLTPAGAAAVDRWAAGSTPTGEAERALARRLVTAGLAHPLPPAGPLPPGSVTVVIPVRDRAAQLARCLDALHPCGARTIVVDDGSRDAAAIGRAAAAAGAEVIRHAQARGPAAARNSGLDRSETPLVAFVDSDCVPEAGWLERLAAHFADPSLAAVAPRIVAAPPARQSWLARYEADRSPLDMGARPGAVGPARPVPYVPSAALLVRRAALEGGFDDHLRVGEDVDLAWRLHDTGWTVRYDPAVIVAHEHRETLGPWLRQRFAYGTSAAALAERHPEKLPAIVLSPWSAATFALLAARRPRAATTAAMLGTMTVRVRLGRSLPPAVSTRLTADVLAWTTRSLSVALTRNWLPLSLAAAVTSRRARRGLALAGLLARAPELRRETQRLPLPLALTLGTADDAAYAAGLWSGCIRHRCPAPLLPALRR